MGEGLTEIVLHPLGRAIQYVPGQFVMLHLETKSGWQRHPFTLASSPVEPAVRVTVKALGDYTSELGSQVRVGMPAVLSGPHGRFSHAKGTDRQIWIAGGVGVTPFLSWLRSLEDHPPPGPVDFFYSVADEAPYLDEIRDIVASHPEVSLHLNRSQLDGRLTVERLLETVGDQPMAGTSVFMCGPGPMVQTFENALRSDGVPARQLFREHFDWR